MDGEDHDFADAGVARCSLFANAVPSSSSGRPELVHTVHILYAEMLVVSGAGDQLDALAEVLGDVRAAGHVGEVELCISDGTELRHEVTF